jgi:proteasome lid subunit RPN8/RPN11
MGEDALRLEQPRVSYDDKRQILLDFSQSILGSDQAGNQPGSDSGRRSGLSVIRQRLADQLNADLKIDFIGEQVADIEALAVKAQALRNPRFETFYLLAIKFSGKKAMKVVDAMAVSARVPSSAPIFEDGKSWDEGFPNHVQFLKDAEADSYILIHNHPSGDSTPSGADIRITAKHGTDMVNAGGPPLMQHIVINHQEFTTIDRLGSTTRKTLDTFAPDPFAWPHPGTEIRQDASAPEKIVAIAQGMEEAKKNPDLLIGFFLNAKMQVVKSLQGTTEDFLSADYAAMVMGARDQGGIYLVVHGQQDHHSKATDLVDRLKPLNDLGMLLEAVIEFPRTATGMTYWSALSQGSFKPSPVFFGADEAFKVSRVQEDAASFSLSPQGINRLEKAIAQRLTAAPIERAQFYERVRNRLAGLTQQLEDMENGIGVFSRKPTDEIGAERRRIQDAIAEAKAIVSSLPIEARGRVSIDFTDITSKETEKGRIKALLRLIADADAALETVLKTQYLQAFEKLLDLAAPDLRQNRQIRGRLTPETQRLVNAVIPLIHLTPNEASAALIAAQAAYDAVEAQYPDPTDQEAVTAWEAALTKHQEQVDLLNTFAALTNGTASEIAQAHKELLSIYTRGRTARQILDQYKRQETASMRRELIDSLGGPVSQPKWARRTKDIGFKDKAQSALLGMSSFHQVANYLFPDSAVMPVILARLRTAERDVTRQRILARKRFEEFGRTAFNLTGKRAIRKLNGIIAAVSTRRDDWNIEIAEGTKWETVKMSEEQAASILDGTLKPGWEGDLIAMESLRQSLADFRLQRLTAQNDAKAFTKSVIRFQRLTARGARAFLEMSDMEALYFLQLADQEQYLPALDRYGFTASVLEKIRKKIDPRATTFGIHLRTEYDAQWGRLNPVHQAIYGLDMPRIRNYAPGMFESMNSNSNVSPEGDAPAVNAMSTGFTKARTHHMARPKQSNALLNYWTSMETTEYFIAYGELMRDMRQVFRSPDVRRTIEGNYGIKAANDFSTLLDVLEIDGRVRALKAQFLAETTQNVLASQSAIGLAFNAGSVLKQVSAGFNHLIEIPLGPGIKATAKAVADPKILKLVWESESVQQRIEEGISPEDKRLLSAAHAASFPGSKVSTSEIVKWFNAESMYRINQGRMPIAWGDAVFTTLTGAAAYKYQYDRAIASGLSDSQAHQAGLDFMDHVITNTAQPATTQDKSLNEITATGAGGLLKIFRSDPRQKLAISANAVALASRGKMSWKEAGRRLFVAWYLYGITGSVLTIIARAVLHDDDDPEEWTIRDLLAGAIAGPISGFGLIGGIIETTIQSTVGTGGFVNSANPLDKSMATTIRTVSGLLDGDELTIRDAHRAAAAAAQVGGAFNPNLAIIPAFMRIVRDATGLAGNIGDVMFDESEEEVQRRIIREEKAATREKSTDRTAELDSLAEALAKLSPDKRDARLKALDKETRARVLPRVRKASMTPEERSLSTMSLASREKAIARILESLPENRRQSFQDRIKDIGLTE